MHCKAYPGADLYSVITNNMYSNGEKWTTLEKIKGMKEIHYMEY